MKNNSNSGRRNIKLLSEATSRVIYSSQSISNVFGVVKELLENALDSKATNIEVKLIDFGLRQIEVTDNGCGIEENEIQLMAKPHYTSKLSNHSDLFELTTYGFRGEALAALSAISDMKITTRTKTMKCSVTSSFDNSGNVTSTRYGAFGMGTTVSVENIFCNFPVRRQIYKSIKRKKEELIKAELFVKHYAAIHPDIRIALYHCNALIFLKPIMPDVKSALLHVWGVVIFSLMQFTSVSDENSNISVEAYLPKIQSNTCRNETCRSTSDSVFLSVNNRPARVKEVTKLIRQFYSESISQENSQKSYYPLSYVSIKLPLDQVDVNLEPAKMELHIQCHELVLSLITRMLSKYYDKVTSSQEICSQIVNEIINKSSGLKEDFVSSIEDTNGNKSSGENDTRNQSNNVHQELKRNNETTVRPKLHLNEANEHVIKIQRPVKLSEKDQSMSSLPKKGSIINFDLLESQDTQDNSQLESVDNGHNQSNTFSVQQRDKESVSPSDDILENALDDIFSQIDNNANEQSCSSNQDNRGMDLVETDLNTTIGNRKEHTFFSKPSMEEEEETIPFDANKNTSDGPLIKNVFSMSVDEVLNPDDPPSRVFPRRTANISEFFTVSSQLTPERSDCWSRGRVLGRDDKIVEPSTIISGNNTGTKKRTIKYICSPEAEDGAPKPKKKIFPDQPRITDMISKLSTAATGKTSFALFSKDNKQQVLSDHPDSSPGGINNIPSEMGQNLTAEQRKEYVVKSKSGKECNTSNSTSETLKSDDCQIDEIEEFESTTSKDFKTNSVKFSMSSLKEIVMNKKTRKTLPNNGSIRVIGEINKLWFAVSNAKNVVLLDVRKLQELVLYSNLRLTFKLSLVVLRNPINLQFLNNEKLSSLKEVLRMLPSERHGNLDPNSYIIDPRLTWNGFFVRRSETNIGFRAEIWQMSEALPNYGVPDLIEILQSIAINSKIDLNDSRPLKLLTYLQEESVRIAKNTPKNITMAQMRELLENLKDASQSRVAGFTRILSVLRTRIE